MSNQPISLTAALASFDALWSPRIVTRVNNYDVRVAKVHGERAKGWAFRWSGGLASAVDRRLLEELRACFPPKGRAQLASVQPELMAAINRWRGEFPAAGAWLVLAEPERACAALHARGAWRAVTNAKGAWLELLERERHRVEGPVPDLVLLAGVAAPQAEGWKFRELQ